MLSGTWIPVRMNCASSDKQTIPGAKGNGRFSFLLPDAHAVQVMECDRCWMKVPRIDPDRSIFGLVDCDFLVLGVRQHDLQKRCMRDDATLFLCGRGFCPKHAQDSYDCDADR